MMNYYRIKFTTKKGGSRNWSIYAIGLTRSDAVERVRLLFNLEHPGMHMFTVRCMSASRDTAIAHLWEFREEGTNAVH